MKTGKDYPELNARFAILDPTLTFTVPPTQTISGAYDSLNHMMEEYFSLPVGDVLADDMLEAAMRSVIRDLPKVIENPEDYQARANLEWASALAENPGTEKRQADGVPVPYDRAPDRRLHRLRSRAGSGRLHGQLLPPHLR